MKSLVESLNESIMINESSAHLEKAADKLHDLIYDKYGALYQWARWYYNYTKDHDDRTGEDEQWLEQAAEEVRNGKDFSKVANTREYKKVMEILDKNLEKDPDDLESILIKKITELIVR